MPAERGNRIECPRCDEQGYVLPVRINSTGQVIFLCDECDAVWLSAVGIGKTPFFDFSTYVAHFGLQGTWEEITVLDDDSVNRKTI
jgi:hypothetical protein